MNKNFYLPGAYNVLDDRTGFKIKSTDAKKQWDNIITRRKSWEARHPQDLLRSRPDRQQVPDPRTESTDVFFESSNARFTAGGDRRVDSAGNPRITLTTGISDVQASDL